MMSAATIARQQSKSLIGAAVLAMITATAAIAADMPGYPPFPQPQYPPAPVDFSAGWYLRGDIGANWGQVASVRSTALPEPVDNSLGQAITGSAGIGVKSNWLRTDVTINYTSPLNYQGTVAVAGDTTAKIQATTAQFNGYIDLGHWYRVSPYIGAGAGIAYVHVFDIVNPAGSPFSGDTNHQWNFAFAGMAGVAFVVAHNLMMDVGYRYLNIGDVSTGGDALSAKTFKNVASHEVRIGLRWSFDEQYLQ